MAVLASGIAMLASKLASLVSSRKSQLAGLTAVGSPVMAAAAAAAGGGSGSLQESSTSPTAAQEQPNWLPFAGAGALGTTLMLFFFASIGTAAGSLAALRSSGWLVLFILLQLG
jgi:hypothetical protein